MDAVAEVVRGSRETREGGVVLGVALTGAVWLWCSRTA
eukprot:COSAG02_NODE_10681_length_1884_cov_4.393277_1_plen_37_part_10